MSNEGELYYAEDNNQTVFEEGDISASIIKDLNKTSNYYAEGFINTDSTSLDSIGELYKEITKISLETADIEIDSKAGEGLETLLGGTILKQIVKYNTTETDTGYRKRIFVRWDLLCQIFNRLSIFEYKKNEPVAELTYLNPNRPTYSKLKKRTPVKAPTFYLDYSISKPTTITEASINDIPIQGQSLDDSVCLMPHQPIFDNLFKNKQTNYDPEAIDSNLNQTWTGASEEEIDLTPGERTATDKVRLTDTLMNFTSFDGVTANRNSIGLVYFNLDYLLEEYESMRLEDLDLGDGRFKTRLKEEFSLFDYIKKIWDDVNDACGGFYDFKLHTEHERPHVARIIDFTVSGKVPEDKIYTFNPQGLSSISRNFNFQSNISNDFSSIISIAAQNPGSSNSLNAMSFKAFHKNIRNRFTSLEFEEKGKLIEDDIVRQQLYDDILEYNRLKTSLNFYIQKLNKGNYETSTESNNRPLISVNTAKLYIEQLEDLYHSIIKRHPLYKSDNTENKGLAGYYRDDVTLDRNAIIPIEFNIQLDGISGVIPLQLFKIQKDKLPLNYKRDDIAFIVKGETHKITAGQDWTVDINGQLTLLNNGEDNPGSNQITSPETIKENPLENLGQFRNPTFIEDYPVRLNSSFPNRNNGTDWHLGIDLGMPSGTRLVAAAAGTVEVKFQNARDENGAIVSQEANPVGGGYGKYIILTVDDSDLRTHPSKVKKILYAHLSSVLVTNGQRVEKGQDIGSSGGDKNQPGAGSSDGPHLHYEVGTDLAFTPSYFTRKSDETSQQRKERLYKYGREDESQPLTVVDPLKIINYPGGIGSQDNLIDELINSNNDGIISEGGEISTQDIILENTNQIDLTPPTIEGEDNTLIIP